MDTRIEIKTAEEWDEVISRLFELGWRWGRCCNRSYDKYKERSVLVLPEDDNEIFLQFFTPRNASADEWLEAQKPVFKVGQRWEDRDGDVSKIIYIEEGIERSLISLRRGAVSQHFPDGSFDVVISDYDLVKLVE
jgi:hypothetical protein